MRSLGLILSFCLVSAHCAETVAPAAPETVSSADPDALDEQISGHNVTADFRERFEHIEKYATADRKDALKPYNVLLVHGLLGEVGLKFTGFLNVFDKNQHYIDYLKDQRLAVEEFGVEPAFPKFKSASIDRSGSKIADEIENSDRPVLIISHSKGGIDTLDALIKLQKKGKLNKVAGWISIQGCFYGTPDADKYENNKFKKTFAHVALKCLGANCDALKDLTTASGEAYQAKHHDEIMTVLQQVPTLCFASWTDKPRFGEKSDGQVPLHSAVLPNTDFIAKSGITHEMTVIRSSEKYDRQRFTKVLLTMMLDKLKPGTTERAAATPAPVQAPVISDWDGHSAASISAPAEQPVPVSQEP